MLLGNYSAVSVNWFRVRLLALFSVLLTWILSYIIGLLDTQYDDRASDRGWIVRLILTLLGYASVVFPSYILIRHVKRQKASPLDGWLGQLVNSLVFGDESEEAVKDSITKEKTPYQEATMLLFCFTGLQVSYLTWGILQERIMTIKYTGSDGVSEKFTDSQFLVFVNRILAFAISGTYLILQGRPAHRTPLYKYAYCSISNSLSSWCQYEALKFVSFPTQVLAKSAKVIPVMLMGRIVSQSTYKTYEYGAAILISIGMAGFLMGSSANKSDTVTTLSGVFLLCGYLVFDSFTANWQGTLFKQYKPSSVQMMCGVNLMSVIFTSASLIQQGGFSYSLQFALKYPPFIMDCLLTAVTSATGQLFIFLTISHFGAVVFTIIMTIRQGLSILLSVVRYGHPITVMGVIGIVTVFIGVLLRTFYGYDDKKKTREIQKSSLAKAGDVLSV
uniref:Adenosine 3'-phospho 5'-phosphosulfate transporter 1 n=1 Tax=Lynceus sp. MCZ IZ 141354 TaxID=1930659 RepID=A0A9N6ZEJ6_9CRUS|nr:EOG090X05CU [Lynceus sp. MCZ IZ 141354]